ncbi:MAG TPA: ABC transporter permease [Aliidongia sp.]|nr:ABC transporter permease [Aliidongia sp.]
MTAVPARRATIDRLREHLVLGWPTLVILGLSVVPLFLLLQVSVAHRDQGGLWSPGFEFTNFAQTLEPGPLATLLYSAELAVLVAILSTIIAFPFTYFITRMARRAQVAWLILLLSTLSLSDVLVSFSWQVMLSKRIGLSQLFVWLGLMDQPESLSPNFGAVLSCLVYLVLPFTVLLLYPALSRLDRHVSEAARTLGASPLRVFFTVIVPMMRGPILSSAILVAVITIGAFVAPQVLGRPEHWTFAILIGKAAQTGGNLPLSAAMALLLLAATLGLTGLTALIGRKQP